MAMRIALDGMGGDRAPGVVVEAALMAARSHEVVLTGPRGVLTPLLGAAPPPSLTLHHAPDTVPMGEHPTTALRTRAGSSLAAGIDLVKHGEAGAFVSAGNTGAVVAFALLRLGRLPGIERPALATPFPTRRGACIVLDVGATADARPGYLLQFARMGAIYAELALGLERPSVGLLNIGSEPGKGNRLAQEAYALLEASSLNFAGNIEGNMLPEGPVDVVVTDGFTGNMLLKVSEGVAESIVGGLREVLTSRLHYRLAAAVLRPAFRAFARRLDYAEYGGAALLGVRGVTVIAHGRSDARAIGNAVQVAARVAGGGLLERLAEIGKTA